MKIEKTLNIKERYSRYAYVYDFFEFLPEKLFFNKIRNSFIHELRGNILEVGVGTGKNLPFYRSEALVTAIDFSDQMVERAKKKLKKLNKNNITIKKADVENLPFSDNSFDVVLTTFVFCSVPDPVQGLKEIRRVLKKDGQAIFVEHVKSGNKINQQVQNFFNPLTVGIFGFNINRDTKKNIYESGLLLKEETNLAHSDIFKKFVCRK